MIDLYELAIARKLSGGGGGSGSVQPLVCEYDEDLGHLDTTFGDIVNAVLAGRFVYLKQNVNGDAYEIGIFEHYHIGAYDDPVGYYGDVQFNGAGMVVDTVETLEALYAEYPFYSD